MRNSRDARSIWRFHTLCKKSQFENLDDAYSYIISVPMFATCTEIKLRWNELLCSRKIVNRHFERKECSATASCNVL